MWRPSGTVTFTREWGWRVWRRCHGHRTRSGITVCGRRTSLVRRSLQDWLLVHQFLPRRPRQPRPRQIHPGGEHALEEAPTHQGAKELRHDLPGKNKEETTNHSTIIWIVFCSTTTSDHAGSVNWFRKTRQSVWCVARWFASRKPVAESGLTRHSFARLLNTPGIVAAEPESSWPWTAPRL